MQKDQFLVKPRVVELKCRKCSKKLTIEVSNIYRSEIDGLMNCPNCGSKQTEVLAIRRPKKINKYV